MTDDDLRLACRRVLEGGANRLSVALHRHGKDQSEYLVDKVMSEVPKSELSIELREQALQVLNELLDLVP